jgi:hypothetical protein
VLKEVKRVAKDLTGMRGRGMKGLFGLSSIIISRLTEILISGY